MTIYIHISTARNSLNNVSIDQKFFSYRMSELSVKFGPVGFKNFRVKVGTVHSNQAPDTYIQTLNVTECIIHPHYDHDKKPVNDLALLKLQYPAKLNQRVKIARIAEKRNRLGEHCVLAGWGEDTQRKLPERLQEVSARYV